MANREEQKVSGAPSPTGSVKPSATKGVTPKPTPCGPSVTTTNKPTPTIYSPGVSGSPGISGSPGTSGSIRGR